MHIEDARGACTLPSTTWELIESLDRLSRRLSDLERQLSELTQSA